MQSHHPVQFGKGYYFSTHLLTESGKPVIRGIATKKRQSTLAGNASGNPDYMAQSILLDTSIHVQDYLVNFYQNESHLSQLNLNKQQQHIVDIETHENINYAVIDLDQFSLQLTASRESSTEFLWTKLINQDNEKFGHIGFHNGRIQIFSKQAILIRGEQNCIHTLAINTLSPVLIKDILSIEHSINIRCLSLLADNAMPLHAEKIKILCLGDFTTSHQNHFDTEKCEIRAGSISHHGQIRATRSVNLIAETVNITGFI